MVNLFLNENLLSHIIRSLLQFHYVHCNSPFLIVVQAEEVRRGTTKIPLRMCHVFSVAFPMMPTFLK